MLDRRIKESSVLHLPELPMGYSAWMIKVDDKSLSYTLEPHGSWLLGMIYFFLLGIVPILSGFLAIYAFNKVFYPVFYNRLGRFQSSRPLVNALVPLAEATLPTILIATLEYEIPDWSIKVFSKLILDPYRRPWRHFLFDVPVFA